MEQIRTFIAIELPQVIKARLTHLQLELGAGRDPLVKWVDPEGIHLTLKFLGNITAEMVPRVINAMGISAQDISPFWLEIGGLGAFPNLRSPRVAWVGVGGDVAKLFDLQRRIDQNLAPLGFPGETRPFSPHLTLGRVRTSAVSKEQRKLGEMLASIKSEAWPPLHVNTISLIRSKLTPKGALYNCIASIGLGNALSKTPS